MAGVKGRSGGTRAGAGRKRKPEPMTVSIDDFHGDMLALLQEVALGHVRVSPTQLRAAVCAVQYTHAKAGDAGKRAQRQVAAERSADLFPTFPEPRIATVNGRRLQ